MKKRLLVGDIPLGYRVHPVLRALWLGIPTVILLAMIPLQLVPLIDAKHKISDSIHAPQPAEVSITLVATEGTRPESLDGLEIPLDGPCSLVDVVCGNEQSPAISRKSAFVAPRPDHLPDVGKKVGQIVEVNKKAPVKIGASKEMQEMVSYAWELSHSMDFVLTIEAESGFNPLAVNKNRNGTVDRGISQINNFWHPKIVRDPRFKDWKFQLEQGYKLYASGTRFYGHDVRHKVKDRFILANK